MLDVSNVPSSSSFRIKVSRGLTAEYSFTCVKATYMREIPSYAGRDLKEKTHAESIDSI